MNYGYTIWSELFQLLKLTVTPGDPPPEFAPSFYRLLHPDMEGWSDADLALHFEHHGQREGRIGSPGAHRAGLMASVPKGLRALEIGPFTRPIMTGPNVAYFDVLDREGLRRRAEAIAFPIQHEVDIDYVEPTGDLGIVPDAAFDCVVSSHCIEHQPDLIEHLLQIGRILRPGGRYYLIIPDKRYCFDHFLPVSDLDEIMRARAERRRVHTIKSVFEHWVLTTHSNTVSHWMGQHDDPNLERRSERALETITKFHAARGGYIDVHAWQFTPDSFRATIAALLGTGEIALTAERVYQTVWGQNEFTAVLRRS